MRRIPIRVRLTAWFVVVMALVMVALGLFVTQRLRADLTAEVDRSLTRTAADIGEGYRIEGLAEFDAGSREAVVAPGSKTLGAQLLDQRGTLVRFSGSDVMREALLPPGGGSTIHRSRHIGPRRLHIRAISVPARMGDSPEPGSLVVAEPLAQVDSAVRRTTLLFIGGGAAALLLAGLGGWAVAGRAIRPVERMTARASAIDIEGLGQRVPVPAARDELSRLARTFNGMLDRLERGVAARERLIADASHELRAPLAAMLAELDVSLRHDEVSTQERVVLESVREEAARMSRVVDNLLTLARLDKGHLDFLMAPHNLTALTRAIAAVMRPAALAAHVTVEVTGDPASVCCDRDRIEQVIANLLDNAIRVSPPGGVVGVDVSVVAGEATVTVCDEGPGIPPEEHERIFERFARLDPARGRVGGAGLGLAISREIASAHGGRLALADGESTGSGSTFVLSIPTEPDALPQGCEAAPIGCHLL